MIEHFLFWEGVDLKTRNRTRGYSRCVNYQHAIRCLNSVKDHHKTLNYRIIKGTMVFEYDSQNDDSLKQVGG